jgi:hypothetical protein
MKIKSFILNFSVTMFFIPLSLLSQTVIPGGDVSGSWSIGGSPYQVMGDVTIPDDSTLSIDPGVIVEFHGHYALHVLGRLLAVGSQSDTILFTVNDTTGFYDPTTTQGGWYGIKIIDTPSDNDTTKLVYCRLQFGKAIGDVWWLNAGGAICAVNFSKVHISHCQIANNLAGGQESELPAGGGIHLAWSDAVVKNNSLVNNRAIVGGAIQIHDSHPVFVNNTFKGNTAVEGGAISFGGVADIIFTGDSFIDNQAESHGGGIMSWEPINWSFIDVTFKGNKAAWGGGLGLVNGSAILDNCLFQNNIASGIGGGMAADFMNLIIRNSVFQNDTSFDISGGLHNWHCNTAIDNCEFTGNSANLGGAILSDLSTLEISGSTFGSNSANDGGAIRSWCGNLSLDSSLFHGNHAFSQGGGLVYLIDTVEYNNPYVLIMESARFIENTADFRCGAAMIDQYNSDTPLVEVSVINCLFENNHAERIGAFRIQGNIHNANIRNSWFNGNSSDLWTGCLNIVGGCTASIVNSLFTYNFAGNGTTGAVGIGARSSADLINCTLAGNSSVSGGALSLRGETESKLINSIFWGNNPDQIALNALTDSTPSNIYINFCDIQNGLDSIRVEDNVSIVHWGDSNVDQQPLFQDILNQDFRLGSLSPCIGSGIDSIEVAGKWYFSPLVDLEGNPRPNPLGTRPDMGAYESALPDTSGYVKTFRSNDKKNLIWVYPNPFSHMANIVYESKGTVKAELNVYNGVGERVKNLSLPVSAPGVQKVNVDFKGLPKGIYYVEITQTGSSRSVKILKVD